MGVCIDLSGEVVQKDGKKGSTQGRKKSRVEWRGMAIQSRSSPGANDIGPGRPNTGSSLRDETYVWGLD